MSLLFNVHIIVSLWVVPSSLRVHSEDETRYVHYDCRQLFHYLLPDAVSKSRRNDTGTILERYFIIQRLNNVSTF
jgi:hypothetical protein